MANDSRESGQEEPAVIINDRRVRYDSDEPASSSDRAATAAESAPSPSTSSPGEEKTLKEKTEEAREGRLLALLSGMVATHLFVDPSTGLPDERWSPREARFYLDLIDLYVKARGGAGLTGGQPEESPVDREEPRLGHIPAILGAMAVHALGVDPQTGRPGGAGSLEAAKLYIELLDYVSQTVGSSMTEEDRSYMKDILYQTKMFFVRMKDSGRPAGGPGV
jgi:hypothetical protein